MNNPFGTFGMANPPAANNANAINPFKPFTPAAAPKAAEKPNNNRPGAFAAPNPPAEEKPKESNPFKPFTGAVNTSAPAAEEKPKESNPFKPFAPAAAPKAAEEEKPNNNRPFGAFGANNAPEPAAKPNQNNPFAAFGAFGGAFGAAANNNANNDSVTPFGAASAATLGKNTLLRDLKDYRELISETEELKAKIKPQSEFPKSNEEMYKKRSFIKYFWPFVVAAPVAGYLIYIISYGIMMSSVKAKAQMGLDAEAARAAVTSIMGDLMGGIAVAIIVAAAIIIFGIIICRRKQGEFNSNAEYMNNMVNERYQKGLENQRMIDLYQEDISKMRKYETMVPKEYQNYSDVGKMIELLEEDRATTIEGCCDIIKLESL